MHDFSVPQRYRRFLGMPLMAVRSFLPSALIVKPAFLQAEGFPSFLGNQNSDYSLVIKYPQARQRKSDICPCAVFRGCVILRHGSAVPGFLGKEFEAISRQ
jgi:hypothetical protein